MWSTALHMLHSAEPDWTDLHMRAKLYEVFHCRENNLYTLNPSDLCISKLINSLNFDTSYCVILPYVFLNALNASEPSLNKMPCAEP